MKGGKEVDVEVVIAKAEQMELNYRTKIIELEKELEYQINRANQYQHKFKDAVLQSQSTNDGQLLEKLNAKENQLNQSRLDNLQLTKQLLIHSNLSHHSDIENLIKENQNLNYTIQQLKNAAISAIMSKEEEIQELNQKISNFYVIQNLLKDQYEKFQSFERMHELAIREKEEEIKQLNEKVFNERQNFLFRLETLEKEMNTEENMKESLLEKTQNLEGNLQESSMVIEDYQQKIKDFENQISKEKISAEQERTKLKFEMENLNEEIKGYEKELKSAHKTIEDFKNHEKEIKQQNIHLKDDKEELERKLTIKRRKDNKIFSDKIYNSFAEKVPNKKSVSASFSVAKIKEIQNQEEKINFKKENAHTLQQITQSDEADIIENFNFEEVVEEKTQILKPQPLPREQKQGQKSIQSSKISGENSKLSHTQDTESSKSSKEFETQIVQRLESEKKQLESDKKSQEEKLKLTITQIELLTAEIKKVTSELQQERKNSNDLRQHMKKSTKQLGLVVEIESMRQHVFKLENALLIEKLQNAERADFTQEKYNKQKSLWTANILALSQKIATLESESKKKKKGFFG